MQRHTFEALLGWIQGPSFSRWRWHLDKVFVRINGEQYYLWRADDQEDEVLESFVTKRRNHRAALKFCAKQWTDMVGQK